MEALLQSVRIHFETGAFALVESQLVVSCEVAWDDQRWEVQKPDRYGRFGHV